MKVPKSHIIATQLEKIIFNLQLHEGVKIRLLKNFTLTICKLSNSKLPAFHVIGEITHPCDKEYCEKVIEFNAFDIYFAHNFENIEFIDYYRTEYITLNYDSNFIRIEDFSMCKEKRAEMIKLLDGFNCMVDSYRR